MYVSILEPIANSEHSQQTVSSHLDPLQTAQWHVPLPLLLDQWHQHQMNAGLQQRPNDPGTRLHYHWHVTGSNNSVGDASVTGKIISTTVA